MPGLHLSLRGLADPSGAGSKAPSPSLGGAGWPGDAPLTSRPGAARPPAAAAAVVSLLSPAFTLGGPESGDLEASCTARLGVAPERLRFFQLVEVRDPRQLLGCSRIVVEVAESSEWPVWTGGTQSAAAPGLLAGRRAPCAGPPPGCCAGFSLQALEEMAAENVAMKQRASESSTEAEDLRRQLAELR